MLKQKPAPKVRALINLFAEGLVDQEKKDTFNGIETDIIEGFFDRTLDHHNDTSKKDDTFIDRNKFFDSFEDRMKAYIRLKDRFQIVEKQEIFDKYFKIEEMEQQI